MYKKFTNKTPLLIGLGSGIAILALSSILLLQPQVTDWLEQKTPWSFISKEDLEAQKNQPSRVLPLISLPPQERDAKLKAIAEEEKPSLDRSRARYLLASQLIREFQGGPALNLLQGLEKQYPTLEPYILLKQGRAYELTNDNAKAQEIWQKMLKTYAESPTVVAETLYYLGRYETQYWEQLLTQSPDHPRTQEIIRQRLKENPNQPQLLLQLAKANPYTPELNQIRDRLVKDYAKQLTPADWDIIGDGYWAYNLYEQATNAYAKATPSPRQAYRYARGLQIQNKTQEAKTAYQTLARSFPNTPEAGLGLLRLAKLSPTQDAIPYLDLIIKNYPKQASAALLAKADLLEQINSTASASQTRQTLLTQYAQSDEAAEYRWKVAQKYAKESNYLQAWEWAQPITVNNPDSTLAPKAAFWVGKWAQKLGRQKEAQDAFTHTLGKYPHSYYAWRSAVQLGWQVGNFDSVRYLNPTVVKPTERSLLPSGSEAFKELYRLGEDEDAWRLFQAEIVNPWQLTVGEQFNLGIFKTLQNQNLEGINLIWSLREREDPTERQQWQALRETSDYWQALFPFPYYESIINWSQQRQLNPLLVIGLIRQESRFEKEIKSPVGATGLMQVMPETGEFIAEKQQLKTYSLTNPNDNINFGTWYLDTTHQLYDNNSLLALASYNAGPSNASKWAKKYGLTDYDEFVEKIPFNETKGYVESVFGNYWNYLLIYNPEIQQQMSQLSQPK